MSEGQAASGWYPVEGGQRFWDGGAWTAQFEAHSPNDGLASRVRTAVSGAVDTVKPDQPADDGAIWHAVGKPLTGIGAGRYKLTDQYLFFEKGTLRTDSQQVPVGSIVDVDVKQSMGQKARGIGTVLVHVQRGTAVEVVSMDDIPNPRDAQRIINETVYAAKLVIQQTQNTMRYEGAHPAAAAPQPTAVPAPAAVPDPMVQLEQLGKLRDAGILTEEEFVGKKAEILCRL